MSTAETPAVAARRELGAAFEGELIGPDDASYDEARALFNAMIDKRPARDRALREPGGRRGRDRLRPCARLAPGGAGRWPQRRRPRQRGRRRRRRSLAAALGIGRCRGADGSRRRRSYLGGCGRRHARARACGAVRDHLHDRRRRADARRRHRAPHAWVRPDDRQPARRGSRAGRRRARHGERRRERRALLGCAREAAATSAS